MENINLDIFFQNPDNLNVETLEVIKNMVEEYPYFQTAWMLYLNNLKKLNSPDYQKELGRTAIRIADRKKLYYYLNPDETMHLASGQVYQQGINPGVNDYFSGDAGIGQGEGKDDLIKSFIASDPKIKISNKDEDTSVDNDISKVSVSENDEIITETYINILIDQKKYEKAIESFGKLSLKYPEKSVYFARRIEEVKKLIDNKSE